jgi:polar amino acid transport system substrate-binding protein
MIRPCVKNRLGKFFYILSMAKSLFLLLAAALLVVSCSKKSENLQLRSLDDLKDKTFCVLIGNIHGGYISEHMPQAKQLHSTVVPDQLMGLESGKCEAIIVDGGQTPAILAERPNIAELSDSVYLIDAAFALGKGSDTLRAQLNAFIDSIQKSGELAQIIDGWMHKTDSMPLPVPPKEGARGLLRIGTTGTDIPITFVKEGELAGYDIDILCRFAQAYDYKVEFSKMDFSALIPALVAGKADVMADNITITPERAKMVDFTQSYKHEHVSALVLKKNLAK